MECVNRISAEQLKSGPESAMNPPMNSMNPLHPKGSADGAHRSSWAIGDTTRVPFWVFTDPEIYEQEQKRIFEGPFWS